ncbi:hypothetical protein RI129_012993 [Pyrocoelia pectoralis]|uniref:sn-1-specific diacylglycerol lipase ABHD11 n=1 Tax=Pyrocoelia pectoralis TaxID=417401 RepID=A0AAN7V0N7_9COLE
MTLKLSSNVFKLSLYNLKTFTTKVEPVNLAYRTFEATEQSSSQPAAPLIILHGLCGTKDNWRYIATKLLKRTNPQRKIVITDARNHGESPHADHHTYRHLVEDIKHLMKQLGIKKTALMGHSMGGRAVMFFGLLYPELVEKLLVIDVSPVNHVQFHEFDLIGNLLKTMNEVKFPSTEISKVKARRMIDKQLAQNIKGKHLRAFLLTNLIEKSDGNYGWRINLSVLIPNFFEHVRKFPETGNAQYTKPTLFVAGGESNFLPKTDHEKVLKLFPNAQFVEIPRSGHWVHNEKPKELAIACATFLNES